MYTYLLHDDLRGTFHDHNQYYRMDLQVINVKMDLLSKIIINFIGIVTSKYLL